MSHRYSLALITLTTLSLIAPVWGQSRTFMNAAGEGPTGQPTTGNTMISMKPGAQQAIDIWLIDAAPGGCLLSEPFLVLFCEAEPGPDAAGTVNYVDNPGPDGTNSIHIDTLRTDWVFSNAFATTRYFNEICPDAVWAGAFPVFAADYVDVFQVHPEGAYLADMVVEASVDACGTHLLRWRLNGNPPPTTGIFCGGSEWFGGDQPTEYQDLEIRIDNCCDTDGDGIRDDGCVWCACDGCDASAEIDVVFGDMGGPFGNCLPDGVTDNNDRFHALNCFANVNADGIPGAYPCESNPPAARNVDAGGAFGSCNPDGVCDGNDAFLALNAFSGSTSCSCPLDGGPAPAPMPKRRATERTAIELTASRQHLTPGEHIEVQAYLTDPIRDLRGYQLHLGISGGTHGALEIVDIAIEKGSVYAGLGAWSAFNTATGQMVAGLDTAGITAQEGAYLATFTLQATPAARGTFIIDLLYGATPDQRTFLFPTDPAGGIDLLHVTPVRITVEPHLRRSHR